MALLEIRHVTKRFGGLAAVSDASLEIQPGEFFTLLGPSGCGKTTLLRMIAGFDVPDAGQILLDGVDLAATPPERRPFHTVFQSYALFPHMTVADNIAFPLRMAKVDERKLAARVAAALGEVKLQDMGTRYPNALSGGQKQRVALARALIDRPRLLLLDEPLAALDLKLREQMQSELISLQKDVGITFVYVTHDQGEALALSHRIAVMNEGRVSQIGTPDEVYEFPANRFVADFIGTCNLLDARVMVLDGERVTLSVAGLGTVGAWSSRPCQQGDRGVLALRPEKIQLDRAPSSRAEASHFAGTIRGQMYLGDVTVYKVEIGNAVLVEALVPNSTARGAKSFAPGDQVYLSWGYDAGRFIHDG